MTSERAGKYVTFGSYRCFDPAPLPPSNPPLAIDKDLQRLLSRADQAIARLDGAASTLPNPDLFVYSFMRQEAALSSEIEGTQASLDDLFEYEAEPSLARNPDVTDISNYLAALKWSLEELERTPLSHRLIRQAHAILLQSGRGAARNPGEFRDGQNHIGPPGCRVEDAVFVPPSVPLMHDALNVWESFLHETQFSVLLRCALAHAQFETIHPFWDGNGRLGRMLITLMLCEAGILERPLLYLSLYFSRYKVAYYERLQNVRDEGDWEGWIAYFLTGIIMTCRSALDTAKKINALRGETLDMAQRIAQSANYVLSAELLFTNPVVTTNSIARRIGTTQQTGANIIARFVSAGILERSGSIGREQTYAFRRYLNLLNSAQRNFDSFADDGK